MMSILIHFACKAATAFEMVNMVNAFQKKKWNQLDLYFYVDAVVISIVSVDVL